MIIYVIHYTNIELSNSNFPLYSFLTLYFQGIMLSTVLAVSYGVGRIEHGQHFGIHLTLPMLLVTCICTEYVGLIGVKSDSQSGGVTESSRGTSAQSEGSNEDTTHRPQTGAMAMPDVSPSYAAPTVPGDLHDRSATPSEVLRQSTSLRPAPSLRQSSLLQQSNSLPSTTDRVLQSAGESPSPLGSQDMASAPGERLLSQQDVLSSSATAAAAVAAAAATFTQLSSLLPLHGELTQLSWIGSGSGGRVYAGLWRGSPVAVKILVSSTPDEVRDSVREALLSRVASHPHMVQCFAAFSGYITKEDMAPRSAAPGPQQHERPHATTQAQVNEHRQRQEPELREQGLRQQAQPQGNEQGQTRQTRRVANGAVRDSSSASAPVEAAMSGQPFPPQLNGVGHDITVTDMAESSTAAGELQLVPSPRPSQCTQGALTSSRQAELMSLGLVSQQHQHQHGEVVEEIQPILGQVEALCQQHLSLGNPIKRQDESQQHGHISESSGNRDNDNHCHRREGGERQQHPRQQYGQQRSPHLWVQSNGEHDRQTQNHRFPSATSDCRLNPDGLCPASSPPSSVGTSRDAATPQSAGSIGRLEQGPCPPCTVMDLNEDGDSAGCGLPKSSHVPSAVVGGGLAPGHPDIAAVSQQVKQQLEQLAMSSGAVQSGPSPAYVTDGTRRFGGGATAVSTASAALFYGSSDDASLGQCARPGNAAPRSPAVMDGSVGVGGESCTRHERNSGGGFAFEKRSLSLVNIAVGGAGAGAGAAGMAAPRASSRTTLTLSDLMGSAILDEQCMSSGELWEVLATTGARPGLHCTLVIMEMCDQGTLQQLMQQQPFSAVRSAERSNGLLALLRTALEVAQGMCHLHSLDIVHGDLKPSNVLLQSIAAVAPRSGACRPREQDARGFAAKVADFGLAAHQVGFLLGTWGYGALELVGNWWELVGSPPLPLIAMISGTP
ncbi:hypothetical protein Vretimale_19673 [Volvox reticuliferus]|uniref:Protein kinase domain-containing protein n=1 Tax=Volvox reticuliferus TaxID=1737510 RepID=A0A8J4LZY1_9CHLO|nr:hypothetical protein Vretimale_19673 [Volvox reticuliferus]